MEEFLSTLDRQTDTTALMVILFLMIPVLAIALFHSFILKGLPHVNLKPSWILFIIYPCLFLLTCRIRFGYGILFLVALFVSTFLLAFIIGISTSIYALIKKSKYNKSTTQENPTGKRVLMVLASLGAIGLFFVSGPMFFFFIIVFMLLGKMIFPDKKSRFLKLQATLPTAKIRSVAMGLAEIQGQLIMIESIEAPIKKKKCIGYRYVVEERHVDDEGKESYTTVEDQTKCLRFYMEDETGKIEVSPENLIFVAVPKDEQYSNYGKRYTQYLLIEGDEMLLIGKASEQDNRPVMVCEETYDVFGIASVNSVSEWNKFRPLLHKIIIFVCFAAFLVAMILIVPIEIKDNTVVIKLSWEMFSWGSLFD